MTESGSDHGGGTPGAAADRRRGWRSWAPGSGGWRPPKRSPAAPGIGQPWGQAYPGLRPPPDKPHGLDALRQRAVRLRHQVTGDKAGTDDDHRG